MVRQSVGVSRQWKSREETTALVQVEDEGVWTMVGHGVMRW
jgi:hypothetical protein